MAIAMFFAQKCYAKWPWAFWGIVYVTILGVSFLMGARDNTIGTDVLYYGRGEWLTAHSYQGDFWTGFSHVRREFLYYTLNYVAASISDSFGLSLFLIEFVVLFFLVHAFKRYMDIVPMWLSMTVYNLYFFNLDLNLLCQAMACSFFLWSMKFYEDNKFKKLLICALVCFFIHKSSAIAYLAVFFFYYVKGKPVEKQGKWLVLMAVGFAFAVCAYLVVLKFLTEAIPYFSSYAAYGKGVFKANVSTLDFLYRLATIFYTFIAYKCFGLDKRIAYFALPFMFVDLAVQLLGFYTGFATRFGYYFFSYEILLIFILLAKSQITKETRYIAQSAIVLFWAYLCIRFNFVLGLNETYPYASDFLGI